MALVTSAAQVRHGEGGLLHDFNPLGCTACAEWVAFFADARMLGFHVEEGCTGELVVYTGLWNAPTGVGGYIDGHEFSPARGPLPGSEDDLCRICRMPVDFPAHDA